MLQSLRDVQASEAGANLPRKPDTTVTKTFRLPAELAERLETFADRMAADTGVPVSQNAALALLLRRALDAADRERDGR